MKRILSALLALTLSLSLFACGKQPVETPTEPATQPVTEAPTAPTAAPTQPTTEPPTEAPTAPPVPEVTLAEVSTPYTDSDNTTVLQVDITVPTSQALPQIEDYYRALLTDWQATYNLNREEAVQRRAEFLADGFDFNPWAVEITSDIVRNDGVTLSVLREVYENFGGAYPMISYQAETFDVATQGRLLLGDLFAVAEEVYAPRLREMIVAQMDQNEAQSGVVYYDFAREQVMSLLEPMDFALTEDALLLFYNDYVLAPHAAGLQHFYLPLADLADLVKPQYLTE